MRVGHGYFSAGVSIQGIHVVGEGHMACGVHYSLRRPVFYVNMFVVSYLRTRDLIWKRANFYLRKITSQVTRSITLHWCVSMRASCFSICAAYVCLEAPIQEDYRKSVLQYGLFIKLLLRLQKCNEQDSSPMQESIERFAVWWSIPRFFQHAFGIHP